MKIITGVTITCFFTSLWDKENNLNDLQPERTVCHVSFNVCHVVAQS